MESVVDTVIIGGGIIGAATAYYLTKAGKKVVVLDRGGIGEGTSSACDGCVFLQTKKPGLPLKMAMASADLYEGLEEELGYPIQFRRPGGLILIETEEMREVMEKVVEQQTAQGMEVEFLTGAQTKAVEPLVTDKIAGSVHSPLDGDVSPIHATRAFIKKTADLGGEIRTGTPVIGFVIKDGVLEGVETPEGVIRTRHAVIASGVWSAMVGELAGIHIPIRPRRGHLLVTEAVQRTLGKEISDARYIATKHDPSLIEQATDPTFRLGVSLSMEQTANGNFLIGSNREFAGYDTNVRFDILKAICEYSSRFVPAIRNLNIIRTFVGMRPFCEDGMPIIGPVPSVKGLFIAAGHEGDGIALAPITGRTMAEMICGQETQFDMSPFAFSRFGKGEEA